VALGRREREALEEKFVLGQQMVNEVAVTLTPGTLQNRRLHALLAWLNDNPLGLTRDPDGDR